MARSALLGTGETAAPADPEELRLALQATGVGAWSLDLASRLHHHQQELRLVLPATSALRRTIGLLQIPAVIPVFDDLVEAATEA
jgi:hypothetical protein